MIHKSIGAQLPIFAFSHCRDVVVAVSKAGGIGVYGCGLYSDQQIFEDLRWIESKLEGQPYGVDVMMPESYVGKDSGGLTNTEMRAMVPKDYETFLGGLMEKYQVPEIADAAFDESAENYGGQRYTKRQIAGIIDTVFQFRPRILVSALGTPSTDIIAKARAHGMLVGALAGKVKHAQRHAQAGIDFVVAQSYEAGGHTGDIGGMVLIPEIVRAIDPIPVIAAGGIVTGRQVLAALALGAQGAWCGTVWLSTVESECSDIIRQKIVSGSSSDAVKTRSFTGKPARYLNCEWISEWSSAAAPPILPSPLQSVATGNYVRRIEMACSHPATAPSSGVAMLHSKPAGQAIGLIDEVSSCKQVVEQMATQMADQFDLIEKYFQ